MQIGALPPAAQPQEPYRYDKPGACIAIFDDRLELTTGILWKKRVHSVPLGAVVGVSVIGLGGSTLVVQTSGGPYRLDVGVGAAAKIRDRILGAIRPQRAG